MSTICLRRARITLSKSRENPVQVSSTLPSKRTCFIRPRRASGRTRCCSFYRERALILTRHGKGRKPAGAGPTCGRSKNWMGKCALKDSRRGASSLLHCAGQFLMARDDTRHALYAFNMHQDAERGWHYHVTPGKFPYMIGGFAGAADPRTCAAGCRAGRGRRAAQELCYSCRSNSSKPGRRGTPPLGPSGPGPCGPPCGG